MGIGQKIKVIRKKQGYSSQGFAEKIGISKATYSNYENENREVGINTLLKIIEALNVTIDDVIGEPEQAARETKEETLLMYFNRMNEIGKDKAIEFIEILEMVPKYKK